MSYTEPTGFGARAPQTAVDDVEARVLDCFARSSSEWLRADDLQSWTGCDQAVLDDLVELGKLEEAGWWALGKPEEERWWAGRYRLVVPEPPPARRRMKFAVGHPNDIDDANFDAVGHPDMGHPSAETVIRNVGGMSHKEVTDWVGMDYELLVVTQDPRPLDAMGPDDWRDLQARLVLVRPDGLDTLTDSQAQEIMADYDTGLQNLSEIIRQRVVLD